MHRRCTYPATAITYLFAAGILIVGGANDARAQSGTCPPQFGNGQLCTANDFNVTGIVVAGPDACTEGETIAIDLLVGLTSTASQRYDVGLFAGDNGGEVIAGASCSFTSLSPQTTNNRLFNGTDPAGFGPYRNLDNDSCGDVAASDGENYRRFSLDSVLCRDSDGDGDVDINGLVVWSQNANQDVCTNPQNPAAFFPQQSSKCQLAPDFNLPITVEPPPSIAVAKRASPSVLQEPGGPVSFFVSVANTSTDTDPITVTSLVDDIHGDLNGQGTCSAPQLITPGTSYDCSFVASVIGIAGDSETDTVTAAGEDDEGNTVSGLDSATVTIIGGAAPTPPTIEVIKFAFPREIQEPGGTVIYAVEVINTSDSENVTIDTLVDNLYGDVFSLGVLCPTFAGVTLAPEERFICAFQGEVPPPPAPPGEPGDVITNVITATGSAGLDTATDADTASVTIIDSPSSLEATKTPFPATRPEPGGSFAYLYQVQNTSAVDTVTITSIIDDVYGDLNGQGSCAVPQTLGPSDTYACLFTGTFNGVSGDFEVDSIEAVGEDDDGVEVRATARAQVDITAPLIDPEPALQVLKTADPTVIQEPGGPVTFTVEVRNASVSGDITINDLQDLPYGDLDGQGSCATGTTLTADPNDVYSCSFTVNVTGAGGDELVDTVTATGTHTDGATVSASDDASVAIRAAPSGVIVTKSATPNLLAAPGGDVQFAVSITNTGADTLTVISLDDSIYGDLDGRGSCALGAVLPAGAVYSCEFSESVTGPSPTIHLDTVTAEVMPTSGPLIYDSARALVLIFSPLSSGSPTEIPVASLRLLALLALALTLIARSRLRRQTARN